MCRLPIPVSGSGLGDPTDKIGPDRPRISNFVKPSPLASYTITSEDFLIERSLAERTRPPFILSLFFPISSLPFTYVQIAHSRTIHSFHPHNSACLMFADSTSQDDDEGPPSTPSLRPITLPPEESSALIHARHSENLVSISPLLECGSPECVWYDFSDTMATIATLQGPVYRRAVSEAATEPPLLSMTVICEENDTTLLVLPHPPIVGASVSVMDVLIGVHHSFQLPAEPIDPVTDESQIVMKKVNHLMGIHCFAGLSTIKGPDVFRLHLRSGEI